MNNPKVIRKAEKLDIKGISKTTNYEQENRGESCKPFRLGDRAVGYFEHEALAEMAALASGYDSEQMKQLVIKLDSQRKEFLEKLLHQIDSIAA